jgi:hypothetical protein
MDLATERQRISRLGDTEVVARAAVDPKIVRINAEISCQGGRVMIGLEAHVGCPTEQQLLGAVLDPRIMVGPGETCGLKTMCNGYNMSVATSIPSYNAIFGC